MCGSTLTFSFSEHVKNTCQACFLQVRDLRRIRWYLTQEIAVLATNASVSCHLDYCNSLFIQNILAHIITKHRNYDHVTPSLKQLQWLPKNYLSMFKTATFVNTFLYSSSPSYFGPYLSVSSCTFSTRQSP